MTYTQTNDPDEPFNGDPRAAIDRIHELTKIACEHLAPHALNLASYNLTVYLNVTLGTDQFRKKMTRELEAECSVLKQRRFRVIEGHRPS